MKCKHCGKEIEDGSLFCGYCGKEQPKVKNCVKCGQEIDADAKFCGYCGTKQTEECQLEGTQTSKTEVSPKQTSDNPSPQTQEIAKKQETKSTCFSPQVQEQLNELEDGNNNIKRYAICGIVAALLVCGGLAFYFTQNSNKCDTTGINRDSLYSQDSVPKVTRKDEPTIVMARLETIIADVSSMDRTGEDITSITKPDEEYLTPDFLSARKLYVKGMGIAYDLMPPHFFIDMWTNAISAMSIQKPANKMKAEDVVMASEVEAKAKVAYTDTKGKTTYKTFVLKKINDSWLVDDIMEDGNSEKANCIDFYKETLELQKESQESSASEEIDN